MQRRKSRKRWIPQPVDRQSLERAALAYLQRYATSTAHLRRVLVRRVQRAAAAHGSAPEEGAAHVDAVLARLEGLGLLDDARFAEGRARALHRRGLSRRMIARALSEKGVARGLIEAALVALSSEGADADLAAAAAYARRRKIGPYRPSEARAGHRQRDLAALSRRGFTVTLARQVIDAESPDALEREVCEGDLAPHADGISGVSPRP